VRTLPAALKFDGQSSTFQAQGDGAVSLPAGRYPDARIGGENAMCVRGYANHDPEAVAGLPGTGTSLARGYLALT